VAPSRHAQRSQPERDQIAFEGPGPPSQFRFTPVSRRLQASIATLALPAIRLVQRECILELYHTDLRSRVLRSFSSVVTHGGSSHSPRQR
jgi:hypothetical protein